MSSSSSVGDSSSRSKAKTTVSESAIRPSILVRLIRHAESYNNEVYRNARYIYRGGTSDFDESGWWSYVNAHRSADPSLSQIGKRQAEKLADFLVPHLQHQASCPVRVITSPMRRTLETIRPTIQRLQRLSDEKKSPCHCEILVNGFYFESEGCHTKDKAEEGMSPDQIRAVMQDTAADCMALGDKGEGKTDDAKSSVSLDMNFVGFPDMDRGWYCNGTGAESRAASEARAAKFYLWLCEYLDQQLGERTDQGTPEDLFDAGVSIPGEEEEDEHDKQAPRKRRRRMALLIGHGDFMSLLLKRIVAGYGHCVETDGVPHRSAFTHVNTGITELEYFGHGRFLVMCHNHTPHFSVDEYSTLRTGGSLKDGWSYLMPDDQFILDAEVSVAFADELEGHVREQTEALKALYLGSRNPTELHPADDLSVEREQDSRTPNGNDAKHFVVKRGLQVVGVATYCERTGRLVDVAVRPSAGKLVSETLFNAVREYSKGLGRSGSLLVMPRTDGSKKIFQDLGFQEVENGGDDEKLEF